MITLNLRNSQTDISKYSSLLLDAKKRFLSEDLPYKKLPNGYVDLLKEFAQIDEMMRGKKALVVIGIGGSDLGTRTIHKALSHPYYNEYADMTLNDEPKVYFMGDTTDPEMISGLMDILNLERTLFLVVSKSGKTIEIISNFLFVRDQYKKANLNPLEHIMFLTDPKSGDLRDIANKDGYKTVTHGEVGGRYSVLSTVGMVPAHVLGVDTEQMLKGAHDIHESITSATEEQQDIVFEYTLNKFAQFMSGKSISVMMPYQYRLFEFGQWYQQLWAESLGKQKNSKGEDIYTGQTPMALLAPAYQHSTLQLFNEGPDDKFFTFIKAESSRNNIELPEKYEGYEQFEFLKGKTFQEILNYELETSAFALTKYKKPNVTITIPQVDAYHLGQLFYFFEVAVTLFGYALDINPFDQPGVELSKNAMYGVLGKDGYAKERDAFNEYISG